MSNEITVKITCGINEFINILENKGFKAVDKYILDDTYFINKEIDINEANLKDIQTSYILIRSIKQYISITSKEWYKILTLTYKCKNILDDGTILNQKKIDCQIRDYKQGENFLKALGYKKLLRIKEKDVVYNKDGFNIAIKDIINGDFLIECETIANNKEYDSINKVKNKILELDLPIDENDFFVKKLESELRKIINKEGN